MPGGSFLIHDDGEPLELAEQLYGKVEVQFQWLRMTRVFSDERAREKFREKLNAMDGVRVPEGRFPDLTGRAPGAIRASTV